jgi:peroxiredoxin
MTLAEELEAFRSAFKSKVPPEIRAAMERADSALLASGILERAMKSGDIAPDFALPGADGHMVALKDLLKTGPVVVSFYRGGWCPYCNLELRALQAVLPQIAARGATLLAISPQTADQSLSTAEKNELAFPVLSDSGSTVASAFGIAFDLAEELRPIYTQFNHALPVMNGTDSWVLPIPATYVIAQDGSIAFAFVDVDYRKRLEPVAVLEALIGLSGSSL